MVHFALNSARADTARPSPSDDVAINDCHTCTREISAFAASSIRLWSWKRARLSKVLEAPDALLGQIAPETWVSVSLSDERAEDVDVQRLLGRRRPLLRWLVLARREAVDMRPSTRAKG